MDNLKEETKPFCSFQGLEECKEDIVIYRKLISLASSQTNSLSDKKDVDQWNQIMKQIVDLLATNRKIGTERILLASYAFSTLLLSKCTSHVPKQILKDFMKVDENEMLFLEHHYTLEDPELFKLIIAHGYLQTNYKNGYDKDLYLIIFDIIYRNCIQYTKYTYFGYKVLHMWMCNSKGTEFWDNTDSTFEQKLEAIIFSNWCNSISEISKQNVLVFNTYLKIMAEKYNGFLEYIFNHCINHMSWQNEIKYAILAEVCNVWTDIETITSESFLLSLCTCLTKNYLCCSGTKVYMNILRKLNEHSWIRLFGPVVKFVISRWESGPEMNHDALDRLCKYWLEPTVGLYKNVLLYLWEVCKDFNEYFFLSHLEKFAAELHVQFPRNLPISFYINHENGIIRLNAFARSCSELHNLDIESKTLLFTVKHFLWNNANACTITMREGIIKHFRIFFENVLRIAASNTDIDSQIHDIMIWLHEFLLDCFEIGSCYQRQILGLKLYKIILSFTRGSKNIDHVKQPDRKNHICYDSLINKQFKATGSWRFTNKTSLLALLRLILDTAVDVREIAASIILGSFDKHYLTRAEKRVILRVALNNCNSSKFYETESGATFMKILANWYPLHDEDISDIIIFKYLHSSNTVSLTYTGFLLYEAWKQLTQMKQNLLKSIVQGAPFYGILTAILKISFQSGPESNQLSSETVQKVLDLLEDAVQFFLSILSSKSSSTEYASSFAEMGLAIDEAIKNSGIGDTGYDELNLTPAHQVIVSCIWMSLKVSCEIASEIGQLQCSNEIVESSVNLIVLVLTKCRHKGAVEAAGVAIGRLTRCLCDKDQHTEILKTHVLNLLQDDKKSALNITRRGAGLSIMFHRIVVNDNRKERPLLHLVVETLLDLLESISEEHLKDVERQHDSPIARRLHFLRTLVADKEVHSHLMSYMERITLTCFRYLECDVWTIRNASLQLFGAVVPRIVGQTAAKKSLNFGNGFTVAHFVTHYSVLIRHIMEQLEYYSLLSEENSCDGLHVYSNVVHILTLLSKLSVGGCDLTDFSSTKFVHMTKKCIWTFLGNPIVDVRCLAAKTYAAMTSFTYITVEIEELRIRAVSIRNANFIHGYLLVLHYLNKKWLAEIENINPHDAAVEHADTFQAKQYPENVMYVKNIWDDVSKHRKNKQPCYVVEAFFMELLERSLCSINIPLFESTNELEYMQILSSEGTKPGFFQFLDVLTRLYSNRIRDTNIVNFEILNKFLNSSFSDQSVNFLKYSSNFPSILEFILQRLTAYLDNCNTELINAMTFFVIDTLKMNASLNFVNASLKEHVIVELINKIERISLRYNLSHLKNILTLVFSENNNAINRVLSDIFNQCTNQEERVKSMAVECLQFAVRRFKEFESEARLTIIHCCLLLLKDELREVRRLIATDAQTKVIPLLYGISNVFQHEETVYQALLHFVIRNHSSWENFKFIKAVTLQDITESDVNSAIENPFDHEDEAFYKEESKVLNIVYSYINSDELTHFDNQNSYVDISRVIRAKYQFQEKAGLDFNSLKLILNLKYVNYLSKKKRILEQEYYAS